MKMSGSSPWRTMIILTIIIYVMKTVTAQTKGNFINIHFNI